MTGTEIFWGIAINFFTGCAQELASRFDARAAAAGLDAERWRQRSKDLETRIVDSLSTAARRLEHSPSNLEVLRAVLSDQVFVADTAAALIDGNLEPRSFAAELARRDPALENAPGLESLAATLIGVFNTIVASEPELAVLVGLRRSEDLKRDVQNVSGAVEEVGRGVLDLRLSSARHEDVTGISRDVKKVLEAVERLGRQEARPLPLDNPPDERLAESTKRRFDAALNELKSGSAEAAAREFRSLLSDLTGDDPNEKNLLFRTTANLGIALHYLGDTAGAAQQFDKAYEMKPDSVRAKANKILSSLGTGDHETAERLLEDALLTDANDLDLIKFKAQLLADQGNVTAAISFLEDRPAVDENYFIALAIYYNQAGIYEKGAQAARRALELNPESDGGMAVLADAIAMPIVFRKTELKLPAFALSASEANALREAVELAKRALGILRKTKHHAAMAQLLINFSAYSAAAGDYAGAAAAAEEAATILPGQPAALANLYMAQMHLNQFEGAAKTARALATLEEPAVATMREMDALMEQREFPRVIELYTQRSATDPSLLNEPHAACLFARAVFKSFDTDRAIKELEKTSQRFPNHPLVLLEQAHIREELHELELAETYFKAAVEHAPGVYAFHAKQQLGLYYYRRENWLEAERHLLGGVEDPLVSPLLVRYLICLYQLGRYRECLSLAQSVISQGDFRETVWELATNCHLHFKDLKAAERLLEEVVRYSDELRHWLKLFEVTFRLHDVQRARKVLLRAYSKHPDSFDVIVNLSGLEFTVGHYRRAFELASRAVEVRPDHPEGHRAVVRCAILGAETQEFSEAEKRRIQASIAQLAGQEGSGLKPLELTDDFSNLIELARQASETAGKAEELFSTKGLPMAFLSRMLGRSPFKIWSGLTAHHRLFVPMARGSQEEQDSERSIALAAGEIVVDISALFTLKTLNMLELLPKVFTTVYVATAVFESIKQELDEVTAFKPPQSVLGYEDGHLVMTDIPPEAYDERRVFLTDLLAFLRSGVVLLSGIEGTIWEDATARKTIEVLGDPVGNSIAVAKGRNVPLYSDDVGARTLAKREHLVDGFSTQAFLRAAVTKCHLGGGSYDDAVLTLLRNNYHFVSEGADTVIRALHQENYALTPFTTRLVSRISEPAINQLSSATILGTVIADIWLNTPTELREKWLDMTAQNLAKITAFGDACSALFGTLAPPFLRMPACFFGISHAIVASPHLSSDQKRIWLILSAVTARAAGTVSAQIYPTEPKLKRDWYEHLLVSAMLDEPPDGARPD